MFQNPHRCPSAAQSVNPLLLDVFGRSTLESILSDGLHLRIKSLYEYHNKKNAPLYETEMLTVSPTSSTLGRFCGSYAQQLIRSAQSVPPSWLLDGMESSGRMGGSLPPTTANITCISALSKYGTFPVIVSYLLGFRRYAEHIEFKLNVPGSSAMRIMINGSTGHINGRITYHAKRIHVGC